MAFRGLVIPGGDASPGLQLVDQALDGVSLLVETGVVADGPAAPALLLRDDGLDAALSQVGAVAGGRVRPVSGYRVGPGAGTADRPAEP